MTQPPTPGQKANGKDAPTDPQAPPPVDPQPPVDPAPAAVDVSGDKPAEAPKLTRVRPVVDWTTSFVQFPDSEGNTVTLPADGRDYPDGDVDALLEAGKAAGVALVADRPLDEEKQP